MNVLIIEDEKIAADNLEKTLKSIDGDINVLDKLESIRDSVNWLGKNTAELIFLDIHLSDGLSFKIFEQIEINTPIIFTTAYDQYAIKAFKLNSVDYLLKPIDKEELLKSLEKYKLLHLKKDLSPFDYQALINALSDKKEYQKRFMVYAGSKLKSIKAEEIAYFYSMEKGTYLCTFDNVSYSLSFSLDRVEEMVDPEKFFRINRRFHVHIDAIENIYTLSKSRIKVELKPKIDEETLVSFNKTHEFRNWLNS